VIDVLDAQADDETHIAYRILDAEPSSPANRSTCASVSTSTTSTDVATTSPAWR
jgi:hypothetical protein